MRLRKESNIEKKKEEKVSKPDTVTRTKTREIKKPARFALSSQIPTPDTPVPRTLKEAQKSAFWEGFRGAIETELNALEKNGTWEYVEERDISAGSNVLPAKFVFDIKR